MGYIEFFILTLDRVYQCEQASGVAGLHQRRIFLRHIVHLRNGLDHLRHNLTATSGHALRQLGGLCRLGTEFAQ